MPTHGVHSLHLGDCMVQCRPVIAPTVNTWAARVWKQHSLNCTVLCPHKVHNNKVFEEPSCTAWNKCHSDPGCRVHTILCCGVPAFQSHNIAGFSSFSTSLHLSSFWDLMNRSVSETIPCYSFLLGFKIKQEENQGSLKSKVCIQIALLLTYL